MFDRVNTALQLVFDAHGIDTPYPIHTMNLQVDKKTAENLSEAFREESPSEERVGWSRWETQFYPWLQFYMVNSGRYASI